MATGLSNPERKVSRTRLALPLVRHTLALPQERLQTHEELVRQRIVVVGVVENEELLGIPGGVEQLLAELEGHEVVAGAVGDEQRLGGQLAELGQTVETVA